GWDGFGLGAVVCGRVEIFVWAVALLLVFRVCVGVGFLVAPCVVVVLNPGALPYWSCGKF
ncbi:hypothetical protein, partial [Pseudomonas syringae group genomosp. 7]|uniref:hypothetical protein n=1 Tax=Pseudomonas syringae group genomosp. 7 TaxID=251699 RepID=UPI0037705580